MLVAGDWSSALEGSALIDTAEKSFEAADLHRPTSPTRNLLPILREFLKNGEKKAWSLGKGRG